MMTMRRIRSVLLVVVLPVAASSFALLSPSSTAAGVVTRSTSPSFVVSLHSDGPRRSSLQMSMSSSSSSSMDDEQNEEEDESESVSSDGEDAEAPAAAADDVESAALKWAREQLEEVQDEEEKILLEELLQEQQLEEVAEAAVVEEVAVIEELAVAAVADDDDQSQKKKFVVIGAGWGGWGAAKALCESGASVTILDAIPDPTGRTPYLSASGKPVEAGTRGFWKDYPNINALCAELGLAETDVFTDYTNSSFYSPDGLEATAPVFSNAKFPETNLPFLSQFVGQKLPDLPSPLGQIIATFPLFERIPLIDRASMVGLLVATVDCLGAEDDSVRAAYDRMTAHELFVRFKLSDRMVRDFITPTLLVGLFKPPEELSALVVMELLYYYALAHTDSFDVRWIKNGTVADSLTAPLAAKLEEDYDLNIRGGCRVKTISTMPQHGSSQHRVSTVEYTDKDGKVQTIEDIDGVVLAVTAKGMNAIVSNSPDLARYPTFSKAASCSGIDVISVRLWLDKTVATRTPANVFSRFEELRGAGGTFFMLDQFQSDNVKELWGGDEPEGSVVACDFYNAGALLTLQDDELVRTLMKDLLPAAVPAFADAVAVDSWVGRYPGAVSWFAPGSFDKRPPLEGAGAQLANLKCAGDWVRMGEREHGAKGLCQERAYVTGLEAANSLLRDCGGGGGTPHTVLAVREDEAQFQAAVKANRQVMKFLPRFWVR